MWVDCRITSVMKKGTAGFGSYLFHCYNIPRQSAWQRFYTHSGECGIDYNILEYLWLRCTISFLILSIIADIQFSLETVTRLSFKLPTESHTGKQ